MIHATKIRAVSDSDYLLTMMSDRGQEIEILIPREDAADESSKIWSPPPLGNKLRRAFDPFGLNLISRGHYQ